MKRKSLLFALLLVLCFNVWGQLATPYDLTSSQNGEDSVLLNWLEPALPFDGYEDFENGIIPPDFSVYNYNSAQWEIMGEGNGYNSDNCVACYADWPGNPNNDWFVSPPLAVTETSQFSFWAANYHDVLAEESFNVLLNTTGASPENFIDPPVITYTFTAGSTYWESFEVDLSEYADETVWIAIQCVSDLIYYLRIDDFTVTDLILNGEERDLTGYNVYRENTLITPEPVTTLEYIDEGLYAGIYEYYVTAVYDEGESDPSNTTSIELIPSGQYDEGFESGDLLQLPWISDGDLGWDIVNETPFSGDYSAKSGAIIDDQTSILTITLDITSEGSVSFAHKTSTEEGWDFLEFYIDDVLLESWSGINEWSFPGSNSFPVVVGEHTFSWHFMKDMGAAGGEDCTWIDNVSFPDFTSPGELEGIVTSVSGDLLADALVSLNQGLVQTYTNESGFYLFPALLSGDYAVTVIKDGFAQFTGDVEVISDQTTQFDVVLESLTSVSVYGIVEDEFGNALSGVEIILDGAETLTTETDNLGEFIFPDVVSNQLYDLQADLDGYESHNQTVEVITSSVDVGTIHLHELVIPVTNVIAELNTSDQAEINWATPGENTSDEFRNDDGEYYCVMSFSPSQFPDHIFGSAFRYQAQVDELKWWLSDGNGGGHPVAQLLVYGLLEDGSPNTNELIYDSGWIPNVDNEWNTHILPDQLNLNNGFFVGIRVNAGGGTYIVFDDGAAEEYPGSYPHTTTYPGIMGNAWGNNNTNNAGSWFNFDYNGNSCNVMVRATGLIIDELQFESDNLSFENIESSGAFSGIPQSVEHAIDTTPCTPDLHESRDVESYDVWRVTAGDEEIPDNWVQIETAISENNCIDEEVSSLPAGLYRYAVIANYPGDYASRPKFSYFIVWSMFADVNISVDTNNDDSTAGAVVRLVGEDGLAALFSENYQEESIADNNSLSMNVWKQEWTLFVDMAGYESYIQENVYVYGNTNVDVILTDIPVPAINVLAAENPTNAAHVDLSWDPAAEEVLWDQFSSEGSSAAITLQDFVDPGWQPFDREGAFDFVLDEPALISKLFFRAEIGLSYSSPTFPPVYLTEPVAFHVAVFQDYNGEPRNNKLDSLITEPVLPNDFWEYEIILDPPFELEAGTHWIGTSAIVDIYGLHDSYACTSRFNRRFTEGNNTEMYYRVPEDGYNQGYDTWQSLTEVVAPGTLYPELCARVVGRSLNNDRSVTGYRISRLFAGDENNPHLWIELESDYPDIDYTDTGVTVADTYMYAIEAIFPDNIFTEPAFSNEIFVEPGTSNDIELPLVTELTGNYPNPFNPVTTIRFCVSSSDHVKLDIFNIKGQLVRTLVDAQLEPEKYRLIWDGTNNRREKVANGVYFYRLETGSYENTKKMLLLK